MPHRPEKFLEDMRRAAEEIAEFTKDKTLEDYRGDSLLRSGVERQFQILGEALYQLEKFFPDVAESIPSCRDIINFRHILVHGYDKVLADVVWGIVVRKLPQLRTSLSQMLPPA